MSAIVIDTNVLLVADGQAPHMSGACVQECLNRLEQVKSSETIVIDDGWLILGEYHNKLQPNGAPSYGSAFLKWLLQVQGVPKHVSLVKISLQDKAQTRFAEFPNDKALEAQFDPSDRKFVAVANAHPDKPPVLQAADSKWLAWQDKLLTHGIRLEILCRCELQAIHARKVK